MGHKLTLSGREFLVEEPSFGRLKQIIRAVNVINGLNFNSDNELADQVIIIMRCLLGDASFARFRQYPYQLWRLPYPSPAEFGAMLKAVPDICGLKTQKKSSAGNDKSEDWDLLYWKIIRLTGWTWEAVDNSMTMSRLTAMAEHLGNFPTADSLIAAYMGFTPQSSKRTVEDEIDDFLASMGQ